MYDLTSMISSSCATTGAAVIDMGVIVSYGIGMITSAIVCTSGSYGGFSAPLVITSNSELNWGYVDGSTYDIDSSFNVATDSLTVTFNGQVIASNMRPTQQQQINGSGAYLYLYSIQFDASTQTWGVSTGTNTCLNRLSSYY